MLSLRLRPKLTLALLGVALVPLGITTLILVDLNLERLRQSAKEYCLAVVDEALGSVQGMVTAADGELTAMGVALGQPGLPIEERVNVVRALLLSARHLRGVALYDRRGGYVDTIRDASASDLPAAPAALPPEQVAAAGAQGNLRLPLLRGADGRVHLPLLAAIYTGEPRTLYGFLWAALDLAPVNAELARVTERRFGSIVEERVFLFDAEQRIVAHPDPARVGSSIGGRGVAMDLSAAGGFLKSGLAYSADYVEEGQELLGVMVPIPDLGWGVLAELTQARAYAGVRETVTTALLVALGCLLLAVGGGLFLGRSLARPVQAVAAAARRVAGGDYEVPVSVSSRDEVGELARAFNHMLIGLKEREFIRETFGRFVTKEVADKVLNDPKSLHLGGEVRTVTIVMSDLRGFTALTEQLGPQPMVALLNRYFTRMADVIMQYEGTINEIMGDGVVIFFGAPTARGDEPLRAVACCVAMQQELVAFSKEEGRVLEMGIGVNTGDVVAGNVGSEKRLKYTVIGDAINLAARLETFTVGTQVFISQTTLDGAGGAIEVGPPQEFRAKGKSEPVKAYPVIGVGAPYNLKMPVPEPDTIRPVHLQSDLYLIQGKEVAEDAVPATVTSLGHRTVRLTTPVPLSVLTNLKMTLHTEAGQEVTDLYAKVMAVETPPPETAASPEERLTSYELRLTSVPVAQRPVIDKIVDEG